MVCAEGMTVLSTASLCNLLCKFAWNDVTQFVQGHWKWNVHGSVGLKFDSKWDHRNFVILS